MLRRPAGPVVGERPQTIEPTRRRGAGKAPVVGLEPVVLLPAVDESEILRFGGV